MRPPSPVLRELLQEPSASPPEILAGEYRKDLTLMGMIFLALGDSVGSGLMYGSGTAVKSAGPAGALISFVGATFTVFMILTGLTEMSTRIPNTGGIVAMCAAYVDESSALAIGYSTLMSNIAASAAAMQAISSGVAYWLPSLPRWVSGIASWVWTVVVNCLPVRYFSYVQRTMVGIEMVIVASLTISVILCAFGAIGDPDRPGHFWVDAPLGNGFWGFADAWLIATFSFDGSDDIATTAGEAMETRRSLKRASHIVFVVLVLIYGMNYIFIGLNVGPDETELGDISPFTLILRNAGFGASADLVNAVVSVAISSMILGVAYYHSRMAREIAASGRAPRLLSGLTSWGVPIPALLATMAASALVYTISLFSDDAFSSALALSGALALVDWTMVSVSLLRFRLAYLNVREKISPASYLAPCWPWGQAVLIVVCVMVFMASLGSSFVNGQILKGCLTLTGTVIIICIYVIHKFTRKSPYVTIMEIEDRLLANDRGVDDSMVGP
jgi:lysine-specific permease